MRLALALLMTAIVGCSRGATDPVEPGALVSISVASVDVRSSTARVVWELRPGIAATLLVQRRLEGAPWKGLAQLPLDANARLVLEDSSVQPGASYSYRVRLAEGTPPVFGGEVAIEVPAP